MNEQLQSLVKDWLGLDVIAAQSKARHGDLHFSIWRNFSKGTVFLRIELDNPVKPNTRMIAEASSRAEAVAAISALLAQHQFLLAQKNKPAETYAIERKEADMRRRARNRRKS